MTSYSTTDVRGRLRAWVARTFHPSRPLLWVTLVVLIEFALVATIYWMGN